MSRYLLSGLTATVLLLALATPAWAQTAEPGEGGESGNQVAGEPSAAGETGAPVGLSSEAINWTNFDYQSDEAEEHYAQYGVRHPGAPVIAVVFNFALLVLLLYLIGRKPLAAYLQARSDGVREGLAEAKKLLEEANERLTDYSARLERLDDEMTRLREEFIAAGEAERDRLVADGGAKAERMRRDAEVRIQQEFSQLREEIRLEMVEKAVAAATSALDKEVKDGDQRRLADEYLTRLEQGGLGR